MIHVAMHDVFLQFEILSIKNHSESKWGYIHAMAIVAISPSFIRNGSGIVLANGETIFVEESPEQVLQMMQRES